MSISLSDTDDPQNHSHDDDLSPMPSSESSTKRPSIAERAFAEIMGGTPGKAPASPTTITDARRNSREIAGIDEIRQSLKKLHRSSKRTKLGMKDPHSKTLLRRDSKDVQQQMTEALEQAFHDLKKKDDDLRMAADLGQTLLDKVADSMAVIHDLEEKLQTEAAETQRLRDDRRGTDRQINSLRIQLEDSEQLNKDLQDEITKLKAAATKTVASSAGNKNSEMDVLRERVRELEEEVARLTALNARLLRDAKAFHDEQAQMAEQLRLARERVAKLEALERELEKLRKRQADFDELLKSKQDLEMDVRRLNQLLRDLGRQNDALMRERDDLLHELQNAPLAVDDHSKGRLAHSMSLADEMREDSNSNLPHSISASESIPEEDENAEDAAPGKKGFFDRLLSKKVKAKPGAKTASGSSGGSFEDDETMEHQHVPAGMAARGAGGKDAARGAASGSAGLSGGPGKEAVSEHPLDGREIQKAPNSYDEKGEAYHDANKEFFMLTGLAVKLNMEAMLDSVETVNLRPLWEKVQKENVPFHKYASWLEKQITHAYIERIYSRDYSQLSSGSSDLPTQSAHQRRVTVAREKRFKPAGHVRTSSSHMELKSAGAAVAQAKRTGGTGTLLQFFQGPNRGKTPKSP